MTHGDEVTDPGSTAKAGRRPTALHLPPTKYHSLLKRKSLADQVPDLKLCLEGKDWGGMTQLRCKDPVVLRLTMR